LVRIRRTIALAALIILGLVGLNNAQSWPGAQTGAQRLAAEVAIGAGVLALASAGALWRRAGALGVLLATWVVAVVAAAGLASWAWGGAPTRVWVTSAVVGAGLAAAVGALAWSARAP
jgi:hypothetical protein